MPYVYILKNLEGRYYVGSTTDLNRRMLQHRSKKHTPSTMRLGELTLAFNQEYPNLKDAQTVEMRLKKLKRKDYLEKIIQEGKIRIQP